MQEKRLTEILNPIIISVSPTTPVDEAMRVMLKNKISCVTVIEENNPVGILTERNVVLYSASQEPQNYFQLGGLFNLSGLSQNLLSGRQMAFVMAQYQRRLSDTSVLPIDMPVYLGASIEGGQLWSDASDISSGDFVNAGSIYLGLDSPIGPIYIAYGRSEESLDAIYLSLGWPIFSNQVRMGR